MELLSPLLHELGLRSHVLSDCWTDLIWMIRFVQRGAEGFGTTPMPQFLGCSLITTHPHQEIEEVAHCESTGRVHVYSFSEVLLCEREVLTDSARNAA